MEAFPLPLHCRAVVQDVLHVFSFMSSVSAFRSLPVWQQVPDVQVCSELRCFGPQLSDCLDLFVAVSIKLQVVLSSVPDADMLGSCFFDVVRGCFVSVAL